ncbi:MAG: hypothetical protein IJD19_04515 [Ruminococcus sp.]|nr:hypothetical protein [Ruminococcus sp.]
MRVSKTITRMIKMTGGDVTVRDGDFVLRTKAIIEPLMYKNKMYISGDVLPLGYLDGGHYLMIAPVGTFPENARGVMVSDRCGDYTVKRTETISAGGRALYVWAVLCAYGEAVADEYDE